MLEQFKFNYNKSLKYIEQIREKMSQSSQSWHQSDQISNHCNRESQPRNPKHKHIKKGKRQQRVGNLAMSFLTSNSIQQVLQKIYDEYFEQNRQGQSIRQIMQKYVSNVHIKNVMGNDENIYQISNYPDCQVQARQYLSLINALQSNRVRCIGLKFRGLKLKVNFCRLRAKNKNKKRNLIYLDQNEAQFIKKHKQIGKQMQDFLIKLISSFKENHQIDQIQRQILTLCKIKTYSQRVVTNAISKIQMGHKREQSKEICQTVESCSNDAYITILIRNNLKKGLEETQIDLLNYFKQAEIKEKNIYQDVQLEQINSISQLKEYTKRKRHRIGSHAFLHTCCAGCFSNHSEIYNPIESCPECGTRMHLHCQTLNTKCQRCKYARKTTDQKVHAQVCAICYRSFEKGLVIQPLMRDGREFYVHNFCLLTHGFWQVRNGILYPKFSSQGSREICKFCEKQSSYHLTCKKCSNHSHTLCAFFSGCSFTMDGQGLVSFQCCNDPQLQKRLSFQRKFKVNFEKALFKNYSEMWKIIESNK